MPSLLRRPARACAPLPRPCLALAGTMALAWLGFASAPAARALDPNQTVFQYNCQTWRRANGLPASAVNAVAQTADRRVWLGTSQGLVSFDGVAFRTVAPADDPSAGSKVITALAADRAGRLWFGLARGGIGCYDHGAFSSYQWPEWGGASATIRTMLAGPADTILAGGPSLALSFTAPEKTTSLRPVRNADAFSMLADAQGRLWIGTADDGLFCWENGRIVPFRDQSLRKTIISALAIDGQGNLWVGTANGLRSYTPQFQERPVPGFQSQTRALLVDRHGVLWIGTSADGLIRHHRGAFTRLRKLDGLASDRVLSLAESADGSLWIGTEDGLSLLSDVKFPTLSLSEGLPAESCLAVAAAPDGSVWTGTTNGAAHFRDGRFATFGVAGADGFGSRWINRIFVARNGDAYFIGARKNIDRFSGGRIVQTWPNTVWPLAFAEDARGILVALGPDLMRLQDDKLVPCLLADGQPVSVRWIHNLHVDRRGSIWLAAIEGVFEIKDGALHNRCHENGVYQSGFHSFCEDASGQIWAAQATGIARFKDGRMSALGRAQGLHDDFVYALVQDLQGHFWFDSSRGIYRVDARELDAVADGTAPTVHCTVYDGEDSVKTTDKSTPVYSGCRSADGRIWFPSSRGVTVIDPAHVPVDRQPPPLSLERVLIDGREYRPGSEPRLEPGSGSVQFDYTALDYRAPLKLRYRYRLDGFDSAWIDAGGRRSAFYTNLEPGHYRFHVQACNSDGFWNRTGATFAFELPRRYYQTLWFRLACTGALFALLAYAGWIVHLRRRHRELQRTHERLEAMVLERTAELRAEIEQRKQMQVEIDRVHRELLETSRQAGMAEVATGVLHNVGNVLNSLNVSATLVAERLHDSKIDAVARLRDLLRAHTTDLAAFFTSDPKGRQIPVFLDSLATHLADERAAMVAEVESLRKNVEHIKEIVAMQQGYARIAGVVETVPATEIFEDALRITGDSFAHHGIAVERDYRAQPILTIDKHKVLQILVNLLRNAKHACTDSGRPDRRIVVRVDADESRVFFAVADNGVGIPPENLTRIFSHGFTTRKQGHGFGLHNGSLNARILGGSLRAASDGPGAGATFTLEVPLQTFPA